VLESEDLNEYLKLESEAIMDEEELEKQMKMPHCIDNLTNEHFPLFATIKRLIYMIDAA
jgi:hypothetical protein